MDIKRTLSALRNQTELDNLEEINILRICISKYYKDINYQCDICKNTDFPDFGMFMDHCYREHRSILFLKSNNWGLMSLYKYNFLQNEVGSVNDDYYKNRLSKAYVYFSNNFDLRFKCNMCEDHDFFNFEEVLLHFHKAHPHSFDFENEFVYMILNINDDKSYKRESKGNSNFPKGNLHFSKDSRGRQLSPPPRSIENTWRIEKRLNPYNRDARKFDTFEKNRVENIRRPQNSSFGIQQHQANRGFSNVENRGRGARINEYQPERTPQFRSPNNRPVREQPNFGGREVLLQSREGTYPEVKINNSFLRESDRNNTIFGNLPNNGSFSKRAEYQSQIQEPPNTLFSEDLGEVRSYGSNIKPLMQKEFLPRNQYSSLRDNYFKKVENSTRTSLKTFSNNSSGTTSSAIARKGPDTSFLDYLGKVQSSSLTPNTPNYKESNSNIKSFDFMLAKKKTDIGNNVQSNRLKVELSVQNQLKNYLNNNVARQKRFNSFAKETETITLPKKIVQRSFSNVAVPNENKIHFGNEKVVKTERTTNEVADQIDVEDENEMMFPEESDVLTIIDINYSNKNPNFFHCIICGEERKTFVQIMSHFRLAHGKLFGTVRKDSTKFYLYSEDISNSILNLEEKLELRNTVFEMRAIKKAELRQLHNLDHVKLPKEFHFKGDWIELAVFNYQGKISKSVFVCDICHIVEKTLRKYLIHLFDCHLNCLSYEVNRQRTIKSGNLVLAMNNVTKYPLTTRTIKRQISRRRRRVWRRKQARQFRQNKS